MHTFWVGQSLQIDIRPEVTLEGKFMLEFTTALRDEVGHVVGSTQWIKLRDLTEDNLLELRTAIAVALQGKVG